MGLAASQARFLGLTARKSNVEYQVQQINQQRTALSNEIMGMYSDYNKLKVPTPPAVNDYNKTVYTLESTYEDYRIQNFSKIPSGDYEGYYDVVLAYDQQLAKAYTYTSQDSVITAEKGENGYKYLSFQLGTSNFYYDEKDKNSTIVKITGDYEKYSGLSTIMESQGLKDGTFYMFMKNDVAYYTSENSLDLTAFEEVEGKNVYYGAYTFDYQGVQTVTKNVSAKAALTQESSGRLSSIQIISCDDDKDLVGNTYSIKTSTQEDQLAYQDAMNEYNYKKDIYENEVLKINMKTEKLQEEDRALELQINQLDTEHNALSTEMDSVSKVIEDTIEAVFKTFN